MIYLLDCDIFGFESVANLIEAGKIKHYPIPSYSAFDKAVRQLLPKVGKDDLVIVDTVSMLANTTRGDFKVGEDEDVDLWAKRGIYFGDKNALTSYSAAEEMIMRPLRNLSSRGARIITVCHEKEQNEELIETTKKRAPSLNRSFYEAIMGVSSAVFKLGIVEDKDDPTKLHRVLYLRQSEDYVTKVRVPREISEKLPKGIKDPTLPKLYAVLGCKPRWMTIYSPPGAGKTTLACSEAT